MIAIFLIEHSGDINLPDLADIDIDGVGGSSESIGGYKISKVASVIGQG